MYKHSVMQEVFNKWMENESQGDVNKSAHGRFT